MLGYGVDIQITKYTITQDEVEITEPPPPPVQYYYIVYITNQPSLEQIEIFINVLFELTIKYQILDESTIANLLATFRKLL